MNDLVIVTGASSNHFSCLKNLLFSIATFEPATRVVLYDLGLQPAELDELRQLGGCEIRRFPFENYPPHVDLQKHRRSYAWKPIIIADLFGEVGGTLLWLDAGNLVHGHLDETREILAREGICSPRSSGSIEQWTHPATLKYLGVATELLGRGNRSGGLAGFASGDDAAAELLERWKACALDPDCITPPGATWENHRYDQAVLSILLYQSQEKHRFRLVDRIPEISVHNDRLSREEVRRKLRLD